MSRACARTIGLRIRISRHDGASARCSASNHPDQPNAPCPFTPPSKTLSTSSAISHPATRTASSEKKLSGRGELRQPHELELGRPDFPRPIRVRVTEPLRLLRFPAAASPSRWSSISAFKTRSAKAFFSSSNSPLGTFACHITRWRYGIPSLRRPLKK